MGKEATLMKWISKEIAFYTKLIKEIEKKRIREMEGTLKVQTRGERLYYYWQRKDESGKYIQEYLGQKKRKIAVKLAEKDYYNRLFKLAEHNLQVLYYVLSNFRWDGMKTEYETIGQARQLLVHPYEDEASSAIKKWNDEEYTPKKNYQEGLVYETERGELVRSKSEVIIANLLFQNRGHLSYKYERPLVLKKGGRSITIYPDFTVINLNTGKITYWEHAGRLDDESYASDFVWKNNLYMENSLIPGKDIFFTYETLTSPLNIKVVKLIIQKLINEEEE